MVRQNDCFFFSVVIQRVKHFEIGSGDIVMNYRTIELSVVLDVTHVFLV